MKTKLLFILTLFLCSYAPETEEKVAAIIDIRQTGLPKERIDGHKNMDFEIYRVGALSNNSTDISKENYALVTYGMKNNELKFNLDFRCSSAVFKIRNCYSSIFCLCLWLILRISQKPLFSTHLLFSVKKISI